MLLEVPNGGTYVHTLRTSQYVDAAFLQMPLDD